MQWIWQLEEWPEFKYNNESIQELEQKFLRLSGVIYGMTQPLLEHDQQNLLLDTLSNEAVNNAKIEGELLNQDSLRSSLKNQLGFGKDKNKATAAEKNMATLMVNFYKTKPRLILTHNILYDWHELITQEQWNIKNIGMYRQHDEIMQIVSGFIGNTKVHYEAPPSKQIYAEMQKFIAWYNNESCDLPALTRAAIIHLYFLAIHPFEDGNGRIARLLTMMSLSSSTNHTELLLLSQSIGSDKKNYYKELAKTNNSLNATDWLLYFASTILRAQEQTKQLIDFIIKKMHFFNTFKGSFNQRQKKVIDRLFSAGPDGFKGGLSANNYMAITQTSASTATRDLQQLIESKALTKQGDLKATRYYLNIA